MGPRTVRSTPPLFKIQGQTCRTTNNGPPGPPSDGFRGCIDPPEVDEVADCMVSAEPIKVKICGIQRPEDALVAAEAGADFVGVVFVPQRRRRLDIRAAKHIVTVLRAAAGQAPRVVGLFADQSLDDVNDIIDDCDLDLVQLCGKESPEYCGTVKAPVIKVVHVDANAGPGAVDGLAARVGSYRDAGHLVTLDRLIEGVPGGTGRSFNWDVAARLSQRGFSFLLAGGLTPDNVSRAVAEVKPRGVDVSSGVEINGVKDHDKIRSFIVNARELSAFSDHPSASESSPRADG